MFADMQSKKFDFLLEKTTKVNYFQFTFLVFIFSLKLAYNNQLVVIFVYCFVFVYNIPFLSV